MALSQIKWLASHPVARRKPVQTWSRWAYWQLRQRLTLNPKVVLFVNDTQLKVYPHEGLTGYWYVKLVDFEELVFLSKFLRRGDVFYDVGANAGAFSIFAAAFGAQVVAFEPVPVAFSRLRENIELNLRFGPIVGLNCAVGAEAGSLQMTTGFGTGNHVLSPGEIASSVEVKVVTLDTTVLQYSAPTFLKMDVEGHELEVLRGAGTLLESRQLAGLLVETFRPHNWHIPKLQAIERLLQDHGFLPYAYDPCGNKLLALKKLSDGSNNTLYFRSPEAVAERLETKSAEPLIW